MHVFKCQQNLPGMHLLFSHTLFGHLLNRNNSLKLVNDNKNRNTIVVGETIVHTDIFKSQ